MKKKLTIEVDSQMTQIWESAYDKFKMTMINILKKIEDGRPNG